MHAVSELIWLWLLLSSRAEFIAVISKGLRGRLSPVGWRFAVPLTSEVRGHDRKVHGLRQAFCGEMIAAGSPWLASAACTLIDGRGRSSQPLIARRKLLAASPWLPCRYVCHLMPIDLGSH